MPKKNSSTETDATKKAQALLDVMSTLEKAIEPIAKLHTKDVEAASTGNQNSMLSSLMGGKDKDIICPSTECSKHGGDISDACNAYTTSKEDADYALKQATVTAEAALIEAISTWNAAKRTYNFAVAAANVDKNHARAVALNTYNQDYKSPSRSRGQHITAALELAAATALENYNSAISSATATLAADAGTLIGAYATYIATTETNETAQMVSIATARQTFWASVAAIRDNG